MKVIAKELGFYGQERRREGAVFTLDSPDHFSSRWMEKVEEDQPVKRGRKPKEVEEEQGE